MHPPFSPELYHSDVHPQATVSPNTLPFFCGQSAVNASTSPGTNSTTCSPLSSPVGQTTELEGKDTSELNASTSVPSLTCYNEIEYSDLKEIILADRENMKCGMFDVMIW